MTVFYRVGELQFEWDSDKADGNLSKHGFTFEEGAQVFKDRDALQLEDPDIFDDEVRFVLLGYSPKSRMLAVVYAKRREGLRLISVRTPTRTERRLYEEDGKS